MITLHRTVVDASHPNGKHVILRLPDLLQTLYPVFLNGLAVSSVVKGATLLRIPLANIIPKKWLTMRGANHNTARIGHRLGSRNLEEGNCSFMHRWPDSIGSQPQQELEYLLIGLEAYMSEGCRLKCGVAPVAQAPVFIIQEDATIGHTGLLLGLEICIYHQPLLLLWHQVTPPYPGRHARHP